MINRVVLLLRDLLNDHLNTQSGAGPAENREDPVVLPDGDRVDGGAFKAGAVTEILINIEEEHTLRPADPYRGLNERGKVAKVSPEIRLNLYVLFVARFKQYDQGLLHLSTIIRYFQTHRVLDRRNTPALDGGIEKLVVELVTLPFSEQNEIWSALRMTYQPSVLYRIRLVAFRDEEAPEAAGIRELAIETSP